MLVSDPDETAQTEMGVTDTYVSLEDMQAQHVSSRRRPSSSSTRSKGMGLGGRPFYGRKQELAQIQESYSRFVQSQSVLKDLTAQREPIRRAVFIHGEGGCGKTALVQQFVKSLAKAPSTAEDTSNDETRRPVLTPLVLSGKYEELRRQDPFSAIEKAFGNVFRELTHGEKNSGKIKPSIYKAIGGRQGVNALKDILPVLGSWSYDEKDAPSSMAKSRRENERDSNNAYRSNQVQHVFGKLVNALTKMDASGKSIKARRPLLLVIDDLQWADSASLDLLHYLVTISLQCPFFLIGTYRSDAETGLHHAMLLEPTKECSLCIPLPNHSQCEINELLSHEVNCDSVETEALASTIFQRTKGNVFFTIQVLEDLQRQEVLRKHRRRKRAGSSSSSQNSKSNDVTNYSWDTDDILHFVENRVDLTVVDSVADRISHLPSSNLKYALVLASCLGSQFELSTLHAAFLEAMSQWERDVEEADLPYRSKDEFVQLLDIAVLEGLLLNAVGSETYTFVHDRVQEAARSTLPTGPDRDQLLFRVGRFLKEQAATSSGEGKKDSLLFMAARHWGEMHEDQRQDFMNPIDMARLHLKCGSRAISMTAFKEAAVYLQRGLDVLHNIKGSEIWIDHYDLSYELYRLSAEMELLLGNYDIGYSRGTAVIDNAKTLLEKISTYHAMDAAMGLQERHSEALDLTMGVLKELNAVPTIVSGIRDFFEVNKLISNMSDEDILSLPELEDPYKLAAMLLLGNAAVRAFLTGNMVLMITISLKTVKDTLKDGLSSHTPLVLSGYGCALLAGMGHHKDARRMGVLTTEVATNPKFNEWECKSLYISASQIELWTESYEKVMETYDRAYKVGLVSGALDYAYGSENENILTAFVTGERLSKLTDRCYNLGRRLRQFKIIALSRVQRAFVALLRSLTKEPHNAEPINWEDFNVDEELMEDKSNHHTLTWTTLYGIILAFMLDRPEVAERLSDKFHRIVPAKSFFLCSLGSFYVGLIHANLAQISNLSKHKNMARKCLKELKSTCDKGCAKTEHLYILLKAECTSYEKPNKQSLLQQMYNHAISAARATGHLNDIAVANERAGEYFVRQKRSHTAKDFLVRACLLYKKWGALGKVEQLLQKFPSCVTREELAKAKIAPGRVGSYDTMLTPSSKSTCSDEASSILDPIIEEHEVRLETGNRWGASSNTTSSSFLETTTTSDRPRLPRRSTERPPTPAMSSGPPKLPRRTVDGTA